MEVVKRLNLQARTSRPATGNGDTVLHHLAIVSHAQQWAPAAAQLLLDSGANGRIENNAGQTPAQVLPTAARGGELHRLLLAAAGA